MAKLSSLQKVTLFLIVVFCILLYVNDGSMPWSDKPIANNQTRNGIFGRGVFEQNPNFSLGKRADPNYQIQFPVDHRPHEGFDIEWWYLTANLQSADSSTNESFGLQWTLFRFRNPLQTNIEQSNNQWGNQYIYMAHASVHSADKHWFAEKFARGAVGNAGAKNEPFELFIDDWQWQKSDQDQGLLPAQLRFNIPLISQTNPNQVTPITALITETLHVALDLTQSGPYVKHGSNGYSIKSGNGQHASHYYSAPFIDVSGQFTITTNEAENNITMTGKAWFDQEWTSQLLDTDTLGWDWLSLHLQDGSKIMAFRMRLNDQADHITGSFISSTGELSSLPPESMQLEPVEYTEVNNKQLPLIWRLKIPARNIDIQISTRKTDQWNPAFVSYYEGMVEVSGSHSGEGFLELTGY